VRTDAGMHDGGRRQVSGQHEIRGLLMIRYMCSDRTHDCDLVRDLCGPHEVLTEDHTRNPGFRNVEWSAVFDGRLGLWIPRLLMRQSSRKNNLDRILCRTFICIESAIRWTYDTVTRAELKKVA